MKTLAQWVSILVIGFVAMMTFGNAYLKEKHAPPADARVTLVSNVSAGKTATVGKAEAPAPETGAKTLDYAQACSAYDPVADPEQIVDIFALAERVTGTPPDVLYGVWRNETGNLDGIGRSSGTCPVMTELAVRDAHAGSHHAASMLRMAKVFGWDRQYGENLERMTCSCPNRDEETGDRKPGSYGGSCGPFQFSGDEIDEKYALPYRLDPMTFCGGALIAGWELKGYHDYALANRLAGDDGNAWRWAISRYYGRDDGHYYAGATVGMSNFDKWYEKDPDGLSILRASLAHDPHTLGNITYVRQYRAQMPNIASE